MTTGARAATPQAVGSIADITSRLNDLKCYRATARFTVSMPQLDDDIVYDLELTQSDNGNDPFGTKSYLIDWAMANHPANKGFSAYFSGNHYRFSGERLQEYHSDSDSVPFNPSAIGLRTPGVHRSAQFFNLLPQAIAAELSKMESDPAYKVTFRPDTTVGGLKVAAVVATLTVGGATAQEAEYLFDRTSALPLGFEIENSPGAISEQSVSMKYMDSATDNCTEISESTLIDTYPDIFAAYRESNYSISNLPGQQLPGFALPTSTGERYSRRSSDRFNAPTIVALLDSKSGFTRGLIDDLRRAAAMLPYSPDIIWAFADNVADHVEAVIERPEPGEHLLMSAAPLIRDCGAASLPTVILVGTDGIVKDVIIGYNNDLASDVIQKMAVVQ